GGEVAGVGGQHHSGLAALGGCFLQEPDGSVDQHYGLARPGTTGEAVRSAGVDVDIGLLFGVEEDPPSPEVLRGEDRGEGGVVLEESVGRAGAGGLERVDEIAGLRRGADLAAPGGT